MKITKMHGLENDFVVVDEPFDAGPEVIALVCDRRRGVGADGLLAVGRRDGVITMRYWNADGTTAEMCGNGLRCVVRYALDTGLARGTTMRVDTPVGERRGRVVDGGIEVELGRVELGGVASIDGIEFQTASVGNPHAVAFVDDPDTVDVPGIGSRVEANVRFPQGTNVEFVSVTAPGAIRMRVWERGVGETRACGTGMAAAAMATRGRFGADEINVTVPGGQGSVRFEGDLAWLSGPVTTVFTADLDLALFSGPS